MRAAPVERVLVDRNEAQWTHHFHVVTFKDVDAVTFRYRNGSNEVRGPINGHDTSLSAASAAAYYPASF